MIGERKGKERIEMIIHFCNVKAITVLDKLLGRYLIIKFVINRAYAYRSSGID